MRTVTPFALLLSVLVAAGLLAGPVQAAPSVDAQIRSTADARGVEVGVWARDLATGRVIATVGADQRFPVLSMSKVYLAAAVLDAARRGLLRLDTPVPVRRQDIVANSPVTGTFVGKTMTYPEIATAALQQSDNTARTSCSRPSAVRPR